VADLDRLIRRDRIRGSSHQRICSTHPVPDMVVGQRPRQDNRTQPYHASASGLVDFPLCAGRMCIRSMLMINYRILQLGTSEEFKIEIRDDDTWVPVSFYDDGTAIPTDHDTSSNSWPARFDSEIDAQAAARIAWGQSGSRVREWHIV